MDLLTTLHRSGGVAAISRQLCIEPAEASQAVELLLPHLQAGLRALLENEGAEGLLRRLSDFGGPSLAAEVMGVEQGNPARGQAILRALAQQGVIGAHPQAGAGQGLDAPLLDRALPLLAMLTAGYISATAMRERVGQKELAALLEPTDGNRQQLADPSDPEY